MAHLALYTKNWQYNLARGRSTLVAKLRHRIFDPISRLIFLATVGLTKIRIQKREYQYFVHWYNYTWTNERAVEISYFSQLVASLPASRILEIGNTLGHYQKAKHMIVDKYENGPGVTTIDVMKFNPNGKFDLIIAISTLEHVGWHETEKRAEKSLEAVHHLSTLLTPSGRLVFSFPIGVNPALDTALNDKSIKTAKMTFLRRKNRWNSWEETTYSAVKKSKYNSPYPNANAICIATITQIK